MSSTHTRHNIQNHNVLKEKSSIGLNQVVKNDRWGAPNDLYLKKENPFYPKRKKFMFELKIAFRKKP